MKKRKGKEKSIKKKVRMKRGKVFYRLLTSYLLILLLPLFISFFLFNRTHDLLAEEAERANGLLLNQLKEFCDETMNDALSITSLVSNNARIEGLIYEKGAADKDILYRAYSASEDFFDYNLANRNIISFYAYLPSLDLIISPMGFYTSHSFYDNLLKGIDFSYDQWVGHFQSKTGRYFSPFQTTNQLEQLIYTMAVFSPLPVTDFTGNAKAFCVVEIDLKLFKDLMRNTTWTDQSVLAIYDRDKGILLSSKENFPLESLLETMNPLLLPPGYMDSAVIDGEKYVLLVNQSDVLPWSYISLVPDNIYNDQFNTMIQLMVLFILIFAVVGGVLVYFTTQQRYKPIHDILSLIQTDGEGDITLSNDEFNMISRGIQMTMDEDIRLKQEMQESLPVLRQRELRLLLKGEIEDDNEEAKRLDKLGMFFPRQYFLLVLLDIELEEDAPASIREECITKLQMINEGTEFLYLIKELEGHVAYLINRNEKSYLEILEGMSTLRNSIEEEYPVAVALGLSQIHTRDFGFHKLYWEAKRALDFRLVKGRKMPLLYEDLKNAKHSYYYPLDEERKLITAIKSGSEQEAFNILDHVFKENFGKEALISIEMARCLMNDLIATLVKAMDKILTEDEEGSFWFELKPIHRLTDCKSLEVLKVEMEDILYHVCIHIKKGKRSHNVELKEGITDYIQEHYHDPGLCVEEIADNFNRNAAYLARFFKEQTSMGLAYYIKQYRVEQSLKLLIDDKKTIGLVAEEIGFSNANAYIRAFKEIEGMTPGQYRENRFV